MTMQIKPLCDLYFAGQNIAKAKRFERTGVTTIRALGTADEGLYVPSKKAVLGKQWRLVNSLETDVNEGNGGFVGSTAAAFSKVKIVTSENAVGLVKIRIATLVDGNYGSLTIPTDGTQRKPYDELIAPGRADEYGYVTHKIVSADIGFVLLTTRYDVIVFKADDKGIWRAPIVYATQKGGGAPLGGTNGVNSAPCYVSADYSTVAIEHVTNASVVTSTTSDGIVHAEYSMFELVVWSSIYGGVWAEKKAYSSNTRILASMTGKGNLLFISSTSAASIGVRSQALWMITKNTNWTLVKSAAASYSSVYAEFLGTTITLQAGDTPQAISYTTNEVISATQIDVFHNIYKASIKYTQEYIVFERDALRSIEGRVGYSEKAYAGGRADVTSYSGDFIRDIGTGIGGRTVGLDLLSLETNHYDNSLLVVTSSNLIVYSAALDGVWTKIIELNKGIKAGSVAAATAVTASADGKTVAIAASYAVTNTETEIQYDAIAPATALSCLSGKWETIYSADAENFTLSYSIMLPTYRTASIICSDDGKTIASAERPTQTTGNIAIVYRTEDAWATERIERTERIVINSVKAATINATNVFEDTTRGRLILYSRLGAKDKPRWTIREYRSTEQNLVVIAENSNDIISTESGSIGLDRLVYTVPSVPKAGEDLSIRRGTPARQIRAIDYNLVRLAIYDDAPTVWKVVKLAGEYKWPQQLPIPVKTGGGIVEIYPAVLKFQHDPRNNAPILLNSESRFLKYKCAELSLYVLESTLKLYTFRYGY